MTILMADLLKDLREDHRNMATMLDLLESQVARIHDGEKPDYELIHDIMRYMTVYSDAVHHPKEDLLYAAMKSLRPELAKGLERVGPEHRDIAERGEVLRDDVEAVASGAPVTRDRLVDDTQDYVRALRKHMAWEEEDLFRRARGIVDDDKDAAVDVSGVESRDPVFGSQRQHSFANLLQVIKDFSS